ncbi:hypothetical protein [Pedobacter sp. JCM 36344]|uniref:hypothetical protein n=1 Tax=Pedobacter sp. JCM 36344 TaxID=3374280 RepID=UPI00397E18C8
MMKRLITILAFLILSVCSYAHVGSPGVTFEGNAGPYKMLVNITPPDVIPGTASVSIYLENATQGVQINAKPVYWFTGLDGTPRADLATPSSTEPGRFDLNIWLMSSGASSIDITIDGPLGKGTVVIPVMALSTAKRSMPAGLGWGLFMMAVFLVVLMVTIIMSSVSDSQLNPSEKLSPELRRKRTIGGFVTFAILVLILWAGKSWWNAAADDYNRYLYQPLQATTKVNAQTGLLTLVIDSMALKRLEQRNGRNISRKMNYLVPDHGKLMHMFLIRAGSLDAFAHLHPRRIDSVTFTAVAPKLPSGTYWVYADITRLSGFSETIVDTLEIPQATISMANNPVIALAPDKDDTFFTTNPIAGKSTIGNLVPTVMCGLPGLASKLSDGSTAIWIQTPGLKLKAGELTTLKFEILDANEKPAKLEPYLGMPAHAVILKDDGSVYIHLHPTGSFSMGSQKALLDRIAFRQSLEKYLPPPIVFADSVNRLVASLEAMDENERNVILMAGMKHDSIESGTHHMEEISFPYTFPQPGNYRIWIQIKRNSKILNCAFDAVVK